MKNINWFKNAKYGLFIHFGLYSSLGGEYNGEKSCNYAEWIQSYFRIPNAKMEEIANKFNPHLFDAEHIVKFAKQCGFKYIVFTAKHHDGFAMYNSKVDNFNIVNASPFKRDILKELSIACKKHDVKLGIYYSQDLDWHEQHGGGYNTPNTGCAGTSWTNNWDFDNNSKNFDIYFNNKCLPQLKELLTNYGEIATMWFDIPFTLTHTQSQQIYNLVKKHQPGCLINSRLGNGLYDYVVFGDNEIPNSKEELLNINSSNNEINGIKPSPNGLYEVCQTLNQSWGHTKHPVWKSLESLKLNKEKCDSLGLNYLVNVGPNENGEIENTAKEILIELMKK